MNRAIALLLIFCFLLAVLFLPVKIPYTLRSIGNVLPSQEWRLVQDGTGSLSASLQDNQSGAITRVSSWQFERGDLFDLQMAIDPNSGKMFQKGDTIVRIYSSISNQQILDLENLIHVKSAIGKELSTGEKKTIVQEAEERLASAKEFYELKSRELAVAQKLIADGVIADIEYQRIKNEHDVAKIEIQVAEKTLQVASTGAKSETVEVNTTEVNTLKKQLAFLKGRNLKYVITAPFDGVVGRLYELGQLIVLHRMSECVVQVPMKVEEMAYIGRNLRILITDPSSMETYNAKLLSVASQTQVVNMRSVGFLICMINTQPGKPFPTLGNVGNCEVHCDDLTPLQYIKRLMKFRIGAG